MVNNSSVSSQWYISKCDSSTYSSVYTLTVIILISLISKVDVVQITAINCVQCGHQVYTGKTWWAGCFSCCHDMCHAKCDQYWLCASTRPKLLNVIRTICGKINCDVDWLRLLTDKGIVRVCVCVCASERASEKDIGGNGTAMKCACFCTKVKDTVRIFFVPCRCL